MVLARILPLSCYSPRPFSDTHPDSTPYPVIARTLIWYSPGFYQFLVLTRIRSLLRYSLGYDPFCLGFSGTRPDKIPCLSRILRYSPGYDLFSGTCLDLIPHLSRILRYSPRYNLFSGTRPNLIPFPLVYSGIVSGSPDFF